MIEEKTVLKQEIGVRALALAVIGIVVGSGIYVIPALLADELGATAILAYFACGLLVFLIALCFAEIGGKTNVSGGMYHYIDEAFGPFIGFLANILYWFGGGVLADAAISNALVETIAKSIPSLDTTVARILFQLVVFGGLALLNSRSVKFSVRLIEFVSFTKLVPLFVLIFMAFSYINPENLIWVVSPTFENIGSASLLLFFAFLGFEVPLSNGAEIKNPKRTVPLGLLAAIVIILILYIAIQVISQGVLGADLNASNKTPLADVSEIVIGQTGVILIIIVTAISMFGALSCDILSYPRVLLAGAKKGFMPKKLAEIHPKFITPHYAVYVYAAMGFIVSVSGSFKQLAILSSASILILYLGVVLATIKLRKKETKSEENTFKVPGGNIIPILAALGILWFLSNLTLIEILSFMGFIAVLSLFYFMKVKVQKQNVD